MTTRLLASFNALDSHSKIALDRHARKNQLKYLSHNCDLDLELPSARRTPISKTTTEIIDEDQLILNNKIRKKDLSCTPSHRKDGIRPFTSPENRDLSPEQKKGQKGDSESFLVTTKGKNGLSLKTTNQFLQRPKWSIELKRVPQLGTKRENSLALVGGALGYTDTSRWCSYTLFRDVPLTAFTEEEEDKYLLSASVGKVVSHQLQQGNVVRVWSSKGQKKQSEGTGIEKQRVELSKNGDNPSTEAVPLSFPDELARESVKILTPRATLAYTPLPIVSTTYPVVCSSGPYQHKPFSTPGFPSVSHPDSGPPVRTVKSAIVHITDTIPIDAILKARKEKEREDRKRLWVLRDGTSDTNTVHLKVLSTDGRVLKDTNVGQLYRRHNDLPPCPAAPPRASPLASLVPLNLSSTALHKQMSGSSGAVGPVLNGINPMLEAASVNPPEYFKQLFCRNRKRTPAHSALFNSVKNSVTNRTKKKDYMFIAKPLKHNKSSGNQFNKQQPNKDRNGSQLQMFDNHLILKDVEKQHIGLDKGSSFLHTTDSRNECIAKCQGYLAVNKLPLLENIYTEPPPPLPTTVEDTPKPRKFSFDPQKAIGIPTAENMSS